MPIPAVDPHPPAVAGMHWFGMVQYIGTGRSDDWIEFYRELFGLRALPDEQRFGILPRGPLLQSPVRQLHAAADRARAPDAAMPSTTSRCSASASACPTCSAAVSALRARGVEFVETDGVHTEERGALTQHLARRRDVRAGPRARRHDGSPMNVADFGMDTITLAGPLEAKLAAMRDAGFSQVML